MVVIRPGLPVSLPAAGIQLAPPAVGGVAALSVFGNAAAPLLVAMLGYVLFQALLALRLLGWLRGQAFVPGYRSFSFGATALGSFGIRVAETGDSLVLAVLAPVLFAAANLAVAALVIGTMRLAVEGQLLPAATMIAPRATKPALQA